MPRGLPFGLPDVPGANRPPLARLPEQSTEAALTDVEAFKEIKQLRDTVAHGCPFDESRMPIVQLGDLLMKYLTAHTGRAAMAGPAG